MPFVDFFGSFLFKVHNAILGSPKVKGDIDNSKIKKLLITRLDSIGDVVLSTPTLEPLKRKFQEASISYLLSSQSKDIIGGNPYIDEIITYEAPWHFSKGIMNDIKNYLKVLRLLRSKKFDLVIDLEGNAKSILFISYMSKIPHRVSRAWTGGGYLLTRVVPWDDKTKHMIEYQLDIVKDIGVQASKIEMYIPVGFNDRKFVNLLLENNGVKDGDFFVVLSPVARHRTRLWSFENFAEIGDWLAHSFHAKIVITGAPNEAQNAKIINESMEEHAIILAGKTKTLKHLAAVMEKASLVIGIESSPMHIAAAVKTPTVALYSTGLLSEYRPYGDIHRAIQKGDLKCRPCPGRKCIRLEVPCIELITVEDVKEVVKEQLKFIGH